MPDPFLLDTSLPPAVFTIDGVSYSLRYDFAALRAFQSKTGENPLGAGFRVSLDNVDTFLWAGLRRSNPDVTLDMIQAWLTPANLKGFFDFVVDAFYDCFPTPPEASAVVVEDPPSA